MIRYDILPSRCGDLLVAIDERGLLHVDFVAGLRALPDMSGWRQDKVTLAPFLSRNLRPILPAACNASPCRSRKRHGVSASGLAGAVRHPLRRDPQLQRHRPRHRQAQCGAGSGCRQRPQPALDHHPLPPGDRPERQPDRLCGGLPIKQALLTLEGISG